MKVSPTVLIICILVLALNARAFEWGEVHIAPAVPPELVQDQVILSPDWGDDPQPDTIFYDDGIGNYFIYGPTNMWADVRFTPLDSFQLRSVYLQVTNPQNTSGQARVYCLQCLASGYPSSTVLAGPISMPNPPPNDVWIDLNFPTYVTFAPGQQFHICYGPAPTGGYPGPGWFTQCDGSGVIPARSYYGTGASLPTTWTLSAFGDFMIRAGGEYVNPYIDLENVNTYTANKEFFLAPGSSVTLKATVENVGLSNIPTFALHWVVKNSAGTVVYSYQGNYGPLNVGVRASYTAGSMWTPTALGNYYIASNLICPGDMNASNDTSYLEQYVNILEGGQPYTYNQDSLSGSWNLGNWGVSFNVPTVPPAKVDSFTINFNGTAPGATLIIYLNDGAGGQPGTIVWSDTVNIPVIGSYTFYPVNVIVTSEKFTIYYAGTAPLMKGSTYFVAAGNDSMMTACWTLSGTTWQKLYSGDWPFTVYLDSSLQVYPVVLEAEPDSASIVIPPGGGSFTWSLTVTNTNPTTSYPIWLWTSAVLPDSTVYPIIFRSLTIPGGATIMRDPLTQVVPAGAPAGTYTFNVYLADALTGTIWGHEWWNFVKLPGESGVSKDEKWRVWGMDEGEFTNIIPPTSFEMLTNYPNPFNMETEISLYIPIAGRASLKIYDIMGREVINLLDGYSSAGIHRISFNGQGLSSGMYLAVLQGEGFHQVQKMVLIK